MDYSNFNTVEALLKYVEEMDEREFRNRMNLCIGVFNELYSKQKLYKYYNSFDEEILLKIVNKIRAIVGNY